MQPDPIAMQARDRIGDIATLSIHTNCLIAAFRALLATHPEPEKVRAAHDQLIAQMLAHPAFLDDSGCGAVLRDVTETLFQPLVRLDT